MNRQILVTNIQRFSIHDGPGIRTTVFLKGCSLCCPWCCNPESILPHPQDYYDDGVIGVYGIYYSPDELICECVKDKSFYSCNNKGWYVERPLELESLPGGVTFSGGEALLQMQAIFPVCTKLHEAGIHIAVETCLFVKREDLSLALECIDLFYVDLKILSPSECKAVERGELSLFLDNLKYLICWTNKEGKHKPIAFRIPVIGAYTDTKENCRLVQNVINECLRSDGNILKIELIKEHNLGKRKYDSLSKSMVFHGVEDSFLEWYKHSLEKFGIPVEICSM